MFTLKSLKVLTSSHESVIVTAETLHITTFKFYKAVGTTTISSAACRNVGKIMDALLQIINISSAVLKFRSKYEIHGSNLQTTSDLDLESARLEHGLCTSS